MPITERIAVGSDTALGDWYVNRIVVHRQPLLLLVSSASLLPMVLLARDVRRLPERLAGFVEARLERRGIDSEAVAAEIRAMSPVVVAPTIDRSVVGIMVDFAKAVPYYLDPGRVDDAMLHHVEDQLAVTPCHAGRPFDKVIFPKDKTLEQLQKKWSTDLRQIS